MTETTHATQPSPDTCKGRPSAGILRWLRFLRDIHFGGRGDSIDPEYVLSKEESLSGLRNARESGGDWLLWLGHAAFLIGLGGKTVLTDPFLSLRAGPIRRSVNTPFGVEDMPPVDIVAVSHDHYDHLDMPALRRIARRFPDAVGVSPRGNGSYLRRAGFQDVRDLEWYERSEAAGLGVTVLPAAHFSRRGPFDANHRLFGSFAFRTAERSLFFAGDTAYCDVFREIGSREGPFDTALLPIGAYEPRDLMRFSHASPEESVQIADDIGAERIVAMHWGTIRLTTEPVMEPVRRFRAALGGREGTVLRIGETLSL